MASAAGAIQTDRLRFRPETSAGAENPAASGARLIFRQAGPTTRLARLEQRAPVRVLMPRVPAGEPPHAIVINTGGGLVGGDQLALDVEVGQGAQALMTTQAAEKVYRSAGPWVTLHQTLSLRDSSWFEYLPQPTLLFEGHRLHRTLRIDLEGSARTLAGELLLLGRHHHGERLTSGWLYDRIEIRRSGQPVWLDALRIDGDFAAALAHPFRLRGARALGLLVYAGADAGAFLGPVRTLLDQIDPGPLRRPAPDLAPDAGLANPTWAGATLFPGLLVIRWLGPDPAPIQRSFGDVARYLRHAAANLEPRLPSIWSF